MATNRSTKILARVYRNLKSFGITSGDLTHEEIYDEMQNAQDEIVARAKLERKINVELVADQENYFLSTEEIPDSSSKLNISGIKAVVTPSYWGYGFKILQNDVYFGLSEDTLDIDKLLTLVDETGNAIVTENDVDVAAKTIFTDYKGQPLIGTIFNNQLKVFPVPNENYAGDSILLYCTSSSSETTLSKTIEPEVPSYWDKAIEYYATSQFTRDKDKGLYLQLFEKEVFSKNPIAFRKVTLQRQGTW